MVPYNLRNHVVLKRYMTEMNEKKDPDVVGYGIQCLT